MPQVIVASKNPVKISAARSAFERAFPQQTFMITGIEVDSGVSEQPRNDEETRQGATNRATQARNLYPDADFYVGMEGGVERVNNGWQAFAWMVVQDKSGRIGQGRTGVFILPKVIGDLLDQGMELGPADDQVFGLENSKQNQGAVGILTNGLVDRTTYYEQAMLFALIPWIKPDYYTH